MDCQVAWKDSSGWIWKTYRIANGIVKEFLPDDSALSIFCLCANSTFRDDVGYFENQLTRAHEIRPTRRARRELSLAFKMVGLSLTVSEIYGVIVRPLTSIISGMTEAIEFEYRRSLGYVDHYKLAWPVGYISETVRDTDAQSRLHFVTFLKICMSSVDETLRDDSPAVTDMWAK